MPARAPTDPYVLILEHTVPQPTVRRSRRVPVAIRPSSVDMRENLDVFNMFPSVESAGRRFASLDRVLRGEFPCFNGTIKALRLPAAHPAALRFLSSTIARPVFRFLWGMQAASFGNTISDHLDTVQRARSDVDQERSLLEDRVALRADPGQS